MYTVQVLLSTYNGETYLEEQIESILNQKDVNVRLLVRDDGSIDGTADILRMYATTCENVFYYRGENSGVVASYFRLFETSDSDVDFYALADQDDVWEPDKLITACKQLEAMREANPETITVETLQLSGNQITASDKKQDTATPSKQGKGKKKRGKKNKAKNTQEEATTTQPDNTPEVDALEQPVVLSPIRAYKTPLLYCSAATNTNENLELLPENSQEAGKTLTPDFRNALIENIARGNSIVFNQGLMSYVKISMPQDIYMHDWWLYLVASCFGHVYYDPTPHYKYRQHQGNALGAAGGGKLKKLQRRLSQSKTNGGHVSRQAKAFERIYHIPEDKVEYLRIVTQYQTSKKYRQMGRSGEYLFRQNPNDQKIFCLMFKTNHL